LITIEVGLEGLAQSEAVGSGHRCTNSKTCGPTSSINPRCSDISSSTTPFRRCGAASGSEVERGLTVRECAHDTRAPSDLKEPRFATGSGRLISQKKRVQQLKFALQP